MQRPLHSYFEESAGRYGDSPALSIGGRSWSYGELLGAGRELGLVFSRQGLSDKGAVIGVLSEKTITAYASLLGIMRSGNTYVPLSPSLPAERLAFMMRVTDMAAIVVSPPYAGMAAELRRQCGLPELCVLADETRGIDFHVWTQRLASGIRRVTASEDTIAYVLFTSGTTGLPKGVPVTHRSASACIAAMRCQFDFDRCDRFTQFSDLSFDVSLGEMFLCWGGGGCLCVPSKAEALAPLGYVRRERITVWSSVPTLANNLRLLGLLKPGSLPSVRISLFCGEALPTALAREWQVATNASLLVNVYGPTEAAIFATLYKYDPWQPPDTEVVPIGTPLPGFEYRIDRSDAAAERGGDRGELLLSGPQVFGGYWRDAASSSAALLSTSGRTWYRTGDLVDLDSRYGLTFHGRRDLQVKVRGYRVELQEVEAALRKATGSALVAVVPVYDDGGRCELLVAFCRSADSPLEIKRRCRRYLPGYMIPGQVVHLEDFPLTLSGKIDTSQLIAMARQLYGPGLVASPSSQSQVNLDVG